MVGPVTTNALNKKDALAFFGQRLQREPEETKSCRIQGESVRPVRPSIHPSIHEAWISLWGARGMDEWMDERDIQIPPVFYRTLSPSVPSGAAAQKRRIPLLSVHQIDARDYYFDEKRRTFVSFINTLICLEFKRNFEFRKALQKSLKCSPSWFL